MYVDGTISHVSPKIMFFNHVSPQIMLFNHVHPKSCALINPCNKEKLACFVCMCVCVLAGCSGFGLNKCFETVSYIFP
jgi:hypothetical protein